MGVREIICAECGEKKEHRAKGLCEGCYKRLWRCDNPDKVAQYNHRYREKNYEDILEYNRNWRDKNPEKAKAARQRSYRRNQEKRLAYRQRYYREHRDEILAYMRDRPAGTPEQMAIKNARRQALIRTLPNTLGVERAKQLLAIGQATYPNEKLHFDHFVSLKHGGGTTPGNMHYIPASLNLSKGDRLPQEVYKQLELD